MCSRSSLMGLCRAEETAMHRKYLHCDVIARTTCMHGSFVCRLDERLILISTCYVQIRLWCPVGSIVKEEKELCFYYSFCEAAINSFSNTSGLRERACVCWEYSIATAGLCGILVAVSLLEGCLCWTFTLT